jgi:hypothetical protein
MTRRARFAFEPLDGWPYPEAPRVPTTFTATWTDTRDLLLAEADHLGANLVVVELDLTREDLRQDGEIRANARLQSGRVRVSLDTRHGAMRYACDRYLPARSGNRRGPLQAWQANARAIALTLQALRAVDRYGAVHSAEQYRGFMAIEAGPVTGFASADDALRWVYAHTGIAGAEGLTARTAYRAAAKRLHPDAGGDAAEWARLDEARRLLEDGGLL